MVFSNLLFIYLFLPLNLIVYGLSKSKNVKNAILLVFSLTFYAWGRVPWMLLLVVTALFDYRNALIIEKYRGTKKAKFALAATLVFDIGVFAVFKYSGFLAENFNLLSPVDIPVPKIALPVGISFYTFQTLTYVIDVYRGGCRAQKSFMKYLLYLSMYFQLVAGPIVRYTDVAEEIENGRTDFSKAAAGIQCFVCGLAKKVIIADTAGEIASKYMNADTASLTVLAAWLGSFMYIIQLYFDFSGYSDMAVGLGKMFGYNFPKNFNYPYISKSVSEFWRRWHMTLGSFFRDYVYIPLGGNRKRVYFNLFVVWLLTGFWHGASWNFVVWGLYNGAFIMLERFFKSFFEKIPSVLRHIYLILVVDIGFVFFYHSDISKACDYLRVMFGFSGAELASVDFTAVFMNNLFFIVLSAVLCTPILQKIKGFASAFSRFSPGTAAAVEISRYTILFVILLVCTAFLAGSSFSPFLYYAF